MRCNLEQLVNQGNGYQTEVVNRFDLTKHTMVEAVHRENRKTLSVHYFLWLQALTTDTLHNRTDILVNLNEIEREMADEI